MVKDRNKGISNITYNYLNLPTQIEFEGTNDKITYLYSESFRDRGSEIPRDTIARERGVAELNYNFNRTSKETYQGEGVQLNYDVQFVYHENVDDAKNAVLNSPGDNIMQLDRTLSNNEMYSNVVFPEDRNSLAGGEKSSERTTTAPGIAFKKEANVRRYLDINGIHEFGHLLGFPDFYRSEELTLKYKSDIMTGFPNKIHGVHSQKIIESFSREISETKDTRTIFVSDFKIPLNSYE